MTETAAPHILLVESDERHRVHLRDRLSDQGYEVSCADTLARAGDLTNGSSDSPADILVTNLLLSDGPAFDLTRGWVASGRLAVGITDTFYGPTGRGLMLSGTGVLELLERPFDDEVLLGLIRGAIPTATAASREDSTINGVPLALDCTAAGFEGELGDRDIVAVIAHLARERVSGGLMLSADHAKKLVYFENGVPIGVKSTLEHERLGNMLAAEGTITAEELERSVEAMQSGGRQQGAALVEMGSLTYPQLEEALQRQFLWKLEEAVAWPAGVYRYKDCPIPAAYRGAPIDDPRQLLWNAIVRVAPMERAQARLWPVWTSYVNWSLNEVDLSRLSLPMPAYELTDAIDGTRTTQSLVEGSSEPGLALLALFALTAFGALAYSSPSTH